MEYSVNEKQIQRDLQMLIDKGGLNKTYARMAAKRATEVVDDVARRGYRNGAYKYGSSKTHLRGNMLTPVNKPIYIARDFASGQDDAAASSSRRRSSERQISGFAQWSSEWRTAGATPRRFLA